MVESDLYRDLALCDVQRVSGLSNYHVKQVIRKLLELKLIVRRSNPSDRRFTLYRVVPLPLWSKYCEMKKELPEPLRDVFPHLFSIRGIHVILLLGSYVRKDFNEESDVDVLVICDDPERVLDLTYHTCLSLPIDLHACTLNEFRNSLYPLIQHVVLYDDGTYRKIDISKVDALKLLREGVRVAQKILGLYRNGLVGFERVFPAIYELAFIDAMLHGSTKQGRADVLERFFAEHSSVGGLKNDLFRLMRIYVNLTRGKGGEKERLDRGREVEVYSKIISEVGEHV
jgi:predicted nucleotidyltransferase